MALLNKWSPVTGDFQEWTHRHETHWWLTV